MGAGSSSSKKSKAIAPAQKCEVAAQRLSGSEVFDTIDVDKSGKLSLPELQAALSKSFGFTNDEVETVFSILDRDGDKEVDRAEFVAGFDKYEALANGSLPAQILLKLWSAGTVDALKEKRSEVVVNCCGCPAPPPKVGLLQDEPPRLVFVGCTGCGKSSLCTAITGQDKTGSSFKIGDGAKSETQTCTMSEHQWLNTESAEDRCIIIDTPGLNDSEGKDEQHIVTIIETMRQVEYVTAIVLVVNTADPRFSKSLQDCVARFEKAFCGGDDSKDREGRLKSFYQNIVICFQRWKMGEDDVADREESGITEELRSFEMNSQFHEKFPHCRIAQRAIPCVFVDSHDRNPKRKSDRLMALKRVLPKDTFRTADLEKLVPRFAPVGYDATSQLFVRGQKIIDLKPVLIEDRVTVKNWHVSPALPQGLSIDSKGVISGTAVAAAAPVLISVVAQSAGGKSKAYTLPPIEILLSELDMKQEIESLLATCDFCPNVTNAPKTEEDMTAILKDMGGAAEACLARCTSALQQKFAGMSQLSKLVDMIASSITAQKLSVETDVRDLHQRLVKDSLKMEMDMQKAEFEVQTALVACTEDYALFKRSVKHLASFEPQKGSRASDTLERGRQWLSEIERVPCNLSGCPCICLRKDLVSHQELCLFKIPLFPRTAIQIDDGVSCSVGFHLAADDPNSDLAQYCGEFQCGPCRHIDSDEPGWYHYIDRGRSRIIRIRRQQSTSAFLANAGSNPWCLSVWNDPEHETELMLSEGETIDSVVFPGLKLAPAKEIKGMKDGYSNAVLAKESVKLMYFGGEWCPYCPPFTKKLKLFFDIVAAQFGHEALQVPPEFRWNWRSPLRSLCLQVIFCSSDRTEDDMLSYFGLHHGDWFALPHKERDLKKRFNEKYEVEGIPTLVALHNSGDILLKDELDIGGAIRKIPENPTKAKDVALALFKQLQQAFAPAATGFLPKIDEEKILKQMQTASTALGDHDSRVICDPAELRSGRFGVAAMGLEHYLQVGANWSAPLTVSGIQEEVLRLADCPDCAEAHATVFEVEMQKVQHAEITRRLAKALQKLKTARESPKPDCQDPALPSTAEVQEIRAEMESAGFWFYGCASSMGIEWPLASVQVKVGDKTRLFKQPLCARCVKYRLDYSAIQADLHYILHEAASEEKFWNGVRDKGRAGLRLADFMKSKEVSECQLKEAEVVSLRLYTSHSYEAINVPLRDSQRAGPHPLPVVVTLIQSGLKKLRRLGCEDKKSKEVVILWRGASNMVMPQVFEEEGGTELAPMSTTTEVEVALNYALKGKTTTALLFRYVTNNSLQRGSELQWLSMFPGENETLYPPLTYVQPTGKVQLLVHNDIQVTVAEVTTTLPW